MKTFLATLTTTLLLASPALADGKIYVQLPDLSTITGTEAEAFLSDIALAVVVSSNCDQHGVSDEEWSLLSDSGDVLAREQLRLGYDDYDAYYDAAFDAVEAADACAVHGAIVQPTIEKLITLGGSREALPDQDAAYQADVARRTAWDAVVETPEKTKTK